MTQLLFINGSMNSGKTTTARLLASTLSYHLIDLDDIRQEYSTLSLEEAIPLVLDDAAMRINTLLGQGLAVVACYVLNESDFKLFSSKLGNYPKKFYTLSPDLSAIINGRGERGISADEAERIKHHYRIGINRPSFGTIINSTHISVNEVVRRIIDDSSLRYPIVGRPDINLSSYLVTVQGRDVIDYEKLKNDDIELYNQILVVEHEANRLDRFEIDALSPTSDTQSQQSQQ